MRKVGIIGGSGLYNIEGITGLKEVKLTTPFGDPSDTYHCGALEGVEVVFLPRHGRGHRISPRDINYRANIYGMKQLGVSAIISVSACGSLKEELKPMDFVVPDQFIDRAVDRRSTFFSDGIVAHVSLADPFCPQLCDILEKTAKALKIPVHRGGVYLNMEGPQFSTRAESFLYRSWKLDIIGMTNATEAKLAREAEIAYATLAAVTDYDCWHQTHESVSIDMIIEYLNKNVGHAKSILKAAIPKIACVPVFGAEEALKFAIITQHDQIPAKVKEDLKIIIGKYIS